MPILTGQLRLIMSPMNSFSIYDSLKFSKKKFFRASQWELKLVIRILIGFLVLYFLAAFMFLGVGGYYILTKENPEKNPIFIVNTLIGLYFMMDLLLRYFFQSIPVTEVKPLLLLPIPKKGIIRVVLIRSLASFFNFIPIVILLPFCIVFSIAFLSLENNFLIFLQFLIVLYFLYVSKIRIKTYFKRLSIDIPFILFALFLPFISKGDNKILFEIFSVSIYETGFNEMISILIKITLCVSLAIVLTATTSNIEIIYGLQKLKLSPLLISILSFAIRYIDVFIDEFKRVRVAMKSRGYDEKGIKGLKPIAYASGALLIRGYERGERVYNSMLSRGFNGSIELKERQFKSSKTLTLFSAISICITIVDRILI